MNKCIILLTLVFYSITFHSFSQQNKSKYTISGYVTEKGSGESLIGVVVSIADMNTGTASNTYGFYSLTVPGKDSLEVHFSSLGYKSRHYKINLQQNTELNVALEPEQETLDEVVIEGGGSQSVSESPQMSTIEIPVKQIKTLPALFGEKDVLKVLQLMPGVQKGSEGSSGLYVRGGGPDQNLIILDDAVVYNAYHLFGFFSLFNGDALKSVELTKGGFPARYGGRLSSVVEMNMKDGNKEKYHGEAGIGLVSSRLTLEGPIVKNKSSFLISGRRTYIDALVYPFLPKDERGGYYFYDFNVKLNYDFGRKNKVYLSGYFGKDKAFGMSKEENSAFDFGMDWGNATATARWNHLFNDKLFSNTSLIFSNYRYNILVKETYDEDVFSLKYSSGIRDMTLKYTVDYNPTPAHAVKFGLNATYHRFTPSAVVLQDTDFDEFTSEVKHIDNVESGIYIEDIFRPHPKFTTNAGFRVSGFFSNGKNYLNFEPRISSAYKLKQDLALKFSYATMNQYLHMLSNTGIGLPTDLWVPATSNIPPQRSRQVAAGIAKDFFKQNLALTVEGYYKKSDNVIALLEGSSFLLADGNPQSWESKVASGQGWSYGAEFLLQKKKGKFSGWVGYTLSWTQLQFDSLNLGKKYYARYDRRHDVSLVGMYKPSDRITFSAVWVYGTGNAITLPVNEFVAPRHLPGLQTDQISGNYSFRTDYGPKNSFRMAPYHRLDLGVQFHKKLKWGGERTWEVSVYNMYNRKNPFFYFMGNQGSNTGFGFTETSNKRILKQITLFPLLPSVSYTLKF